jgi:AcrR family transcriptional regulator
MLHLSCSRSECYKKGVSAPQPSSADAKRDRRRAQIVSKLSGHVLRAGLGDVGLRRLARVAGTSDRMLLYYFRNKDELLMAILLEIGKGLAETVGERVGAEPLPPAEALTRLWEVLKGEAFADQLRLWLDLSSRASRGDPVFGAIVASVRDRWVEWTSRLLDVPAADKPAVALLLMGAIDGQVVLFPTDLARGDPAIARLVKALDHA